MGKRQRALARVFGVIDNDARTMLWEQGARARASQGLAGYASGSLDVGGHAERPELRSA